MMTVDEIKEKLTQILADEFEADVSTITPEAPLMETLDLDSLDVVDIVILIEKNFGIILKQEDFVGVVTFQDFFDLISKKIDN